jgi:ABC-2 type transport system ATP-binding protein
VSGLADLCQTVHELEQGRIVRSYTPLEERPADLPFRVPAYEEDKVILLNPADVLYVEVEEGRTWLYTAEQRLATHSTLAELERRLGRSGFFRAHRSYLVNLQRVKEVTPYTRDSFTLILDDAVGTALPLSKAAARELRALLGF